MFLQKLRFLPAILIFISSAAIAQKAENLRFEQAGKQIIIYYDLTGTRAGQTYDVQVFCSTDGGKTFSGPLQKVTGEAGSSINAGTNKKVTWDVLSERKMLVGDILFEIRIKSTGAGTVSDRDGNVYKTVIIGTQIWMAENLRTTKYNDGTSIPQVTDAAAWSNLMTPGYCWYNNDAATYKATYGALYNWYTVNRGNLCPSGWHVPSDAEWTGLTAYLGGEAFAGGKLKEAGTTHWRTPNTGATNESGFTALPGGGRLNFGTYYYIGSYGYWWCSTEYSTPNAWNRSMYYGNANVNRVDYDKQYGFSVRCLRD
jgi:uncharacterized protein (TIGR02145 family)